MPKIIENLENLGYKSDISEEDFSEGPPNIIFMDAVIWLSSELANVCGLESYVTCVDDSEDSLGFLVEVSSLLKELCCPYKSLIAGQITERLISSDDKRLLIAYLCTELQAAKILTAKTQELKNAKKKETPMQIELDESGTAKELKEMLICLRLPKPPETITPQQLFGKVEKELKQFSEPSTPREMVGELLFSGCLTEKQWFQLERLYKEMFNEYQTRRQLLITRLDVTVESFLWSDRLKAKSEAVINMYDKTKSGIILEPLVKISHVLSAKSELAIIEKTSCASVRKNTKSSVNNVVIGAVPDRGGRPEEQQPPPPEVPSWQKNDSSSRGGFKPSNAPPSANAAYGRENTGYGRENTGYGRENTGYRRDNIGHGRENTGYKNYSYSQDENSNLRTPTENNYKGDMSRGNYNKGGRNDYNNAAPLPVYQPVNYCAQIGNPQFGFGGYMASGDNFQQYGMADGISQVNQYQSRGAPRGSGNRPRGSYSDRGSNQSRGGRGQRGGRGRY